ncbi:MAG: hypothetical protein LBU09_03900 [Endomicrobium sp.]|jgi:hypothetical protein|nr:hypothetical protein [Endomicrobium sp.]
MPNIGVGAKYFISRYAGIFADFGGQLNGKAKWEVLERDFSGFAFTEE